MWYDRGLEAGKSWIQDVERKIYAYDCKGVLCFVGESCLNSPSLLREYQLARRYNKPVVVCDIGSYLEQKTESLFGEDEEAFETWVKSLIVPKAPQIELPSAVPQAEEDLLRAVFGMHLGALMDASAKAEELRSALLKLPLPRLLVYGQGDTDEDGKMVRGIKDITVRSVCIPDYADRARKDPVLGIQRGSFANCPYLETVRMGNQWHWILEYSFYHCVRLREVDLGDPVDARALYMNAFDGCPLLQELRVPRGTNLIGRAEYLRKITFDPSEQDASFTLKGSPCLREIIVPGMTSMSEQALAECEQLRHFDIPSNCVEIGNGAMQGCTALQEIRIPQATKRIGEHAFAGCVALQQVDCSAECVDVGQEAFAGCVGLKELVLQGIRRIESGAMRDCTQLQSLELRGDKIYVARDAFAGCKTLQTVTIDAVQIANFDVATDAEPQDLCAAQVFGNAHTLYLSERTRGVDTTGWTQTASDRQGYVQYTAGGAL